MRLRNFLAAAGVLTLAACTGSPSSPIDPSAVEGSMAAKPPSNTPHVLGFSGDMSGNGAVQGSITGSFAAGNLKSSASGTYTLSIATVDGDPAFCTSEDLATVTAGLGGNGNLVDARSGSLSLSSSQASAVDGRTSLVWQLNNIAGSDGRTWSITGNTTTNFPAFLDPGSTTSSLTITHTNGVIGFNRFAAGSKKKTDFTAGCRVSFTMTLAKP